MSYETTTIAVEPERENLSDIDMKTYSDCERDLERIHGQILFSSISPEQKINIDYTTHLVYDGFLSAYRNHRPITISPDIIWLLISQPFSNHVSSNPEKFRHMFVNFQGKKLLHVIRLDLNFNTMTAKDWETIFPEFISQMSTYTGSDITNALKPDFTTTTSVSAAVGQLTIMSTMKHYFDYKVSVLGCGFPHVTIEGSVEDWTKIVDKLSSLSKYDFEWFTKETIPIINKIIDTKKGNVDENFWKTMLKIKNGHGMYDPGFVNGWLLQFFPFDKNGHKLHGFVSDDDELQNEIQEIPFILEVSGQCSFKCIFLAGFVGVSQDKKTKSIKPEIGWFIKLDDSKKSEESKNRMDHAEHLLQESQFEIDEVDKYVQESQFEIDEIDKYVQESQFEIDEVDKYVQESQFAIVKIGKCLQKCLHWLFTFFSFFIRQYFKL